MKHFFINLLFISVALSSIPTLDYNEWISLQKGDISIAYTEKDYTWCFSMSIFDNKMEDLLNIIEDVENYHQIFDSIVKSTRDKNDIVHIMVDYPIPLSDRDYVVKFDKISKPQEIIYRFHSATNFVIPEDKNYIRLNNAAGEWRLKDMNNDKTLVSYTWNGELKGSAPMWILKKAWIRQGNEIMINLKERLEK
tara:strand:+ start:238 stop:819 length:582 start_codon:yes stop_codon:yes gene_type:complete